MDIRITNAVPEAARISANRLTGFIRLVLNYLPTAVVIALIALYYVQLSHMG